MAKKAAKPKVRRMTIADDGTFTPNPLKSNGGDHVRIMIPENKSVTITVSIEVDPQGGGGGPIIITS